MTSTDSIFELPAPRRDALLAPGDSLPFFLVLGITGIALCWSALAGISFDRPAALAAAPCALAAAFSFRRFRHESAAADIAFYVGLWLLYSVFATELTFLATTLDFPLRDRWLMAADRALGFDWMGWARFLTGHPLLKSFSDVTYASISVQPVLMVVICAFWAPKTRNGEFLTSVILGFIATLLVYVLVPNIGPAAMYGASSLSTGIIRHLRESFPGPYSYNGIVPFPSFHTVIAVLFTLANRDNRRRLLAFGALNLAMLIGVPFQGDHYLIDMGAGAVIGIAAFLAARRIYRA